MKICPDRYPGPYGILGGPGAPYARRIVDLKQDNAGSLPSHLHFVQTDLLVESSTFPTVAVLQKPFVLQLEARHYQHDRFAAISRTLLLRGSPLFISPTIPLTLPNTGDQLQQLEQRTYSSNSAIDNPVKIYARRVFKGKKGHTSRGIILNTLNPQEEILLVFSTSQGLDLHQGDDGKWKMEKISMRSNAGCVVLGLFRSIRYDAEQTVLGFGKSGKDGKIYQDLEVSAAHNRLEAINAVVKRLRNPDGATFEEIENHDGTTNVWDDLYLAMTDPASYKQKVDLSGNTKGLIWNVEKLITVRQLLIFKGLNKKYL
ncbi:hypothetical protein C8J55DRAFT_483897 [Lentinula edodes]|uniref:Uncharacterized protein n=1 Tax=Lentinula lateritia TaxID=40482 RepID=A0A9W9E2Q0_9AGAR|nr:hypothetical protein C8J55DRAFT_483897 [Lentinula edodes]